MAVHRPQAAVTQRAVTLLVRAGMFDNLSQSLDKAWDIVRKDGKLTPENVKGPMREIRRALLEADVGTPTAARPISKLLADLRVLACTGQPAHCAQVHNRPGSQGSGGQGGQGRQARAAAHQDRER